MPISFKKLLSYLVLNYKKKKAMRTILIYFFLTIVTCLKAQNFKEVEDLIAGERYDDAVNMLQAMKNKEPRNPYVYFGLGEATLNSFISDPFSDTKSNVVKKATDFFREGVKTDSLNPLNYVGLGIVELYDTDDTITADRYFMKAEKLIPEKRKRIKDLHITTVLKLSTAELYAQNPRIYKSKMYVERLKKMAPKMPEVYIANGDILLYKTSNAGEAVSSYEKALSLRNDPLTNVLIGEIFVSARMYNDAQKYFEQAIKVDSMFAPAYKGFGDLYYAENQNSKAKNYYSRFLQMTGNNIPAKIIYTKALFKGKDYPGALKEAEEVIQKDTSKRYIYRIAAYSAYRMDPPDLEKASHYMELLFNKAKKEELINQDFLNYGRILLDQHKDSVDINKGVSMLEEAYRADTTDQSLIAEIFKDAYQYKVYPVALKYLTLLIKYGANTQNNYIFLGKVYYQMKEYTQADSIFQIAIQKDSTNIEAYRWRGYALSWLDPEMKTGIAKPVFEKMIELGSSDTAKYKKELVDANSYLGSYYLLETNPDLKKSQRYFEKILELGTENKELLLKSYHSLAYISTKNKEYQKAKGYYEKVLSLQPDDEVALKGLRYIRKYMKPTPI